MDEVRGWVVIGCVEEKDSGRNWRWCVVDVISFIVEDKMVEFLVDSYSYLILS